MDRGLLDKEGQEDRGSFQECREDGECGSFLLTEICREKVLRINERDNKARARVGDLRE